MGDPSKIRVHAISLAEVGVIVDSCKCMFKEDLRCARMELHKRDSSIAHASTLSTVARSFQPTATGAPTDPVAPEEPTRPLYSSEEEGAVMDVSNCLRRPRRCGARRHTG